MEIAGEALKELGAMKILDIMATKSLGICDDHAAIYENLRLYIAAKRSVIFPTNALLRAAEFVCRFIVRGSDRSMRRSHVLF